MYTVQTNWRHRKINHPTESTQYRQKYLKFDFLVFAVGAPHAKENPTLMERKAGGTPPHQKLEPPLEKNPPPKKIKKKNKKKK